MHIEDLPVEIIILIFKKLTLQEIESCCKTCYKWRHIGVKYFLTNQFTTFSALDHVTEQYVQEIDFDDPDVVWEFWKECHYYKSNLKFFIFKETFVSFKFSFQLICY